jgi:hypothetical protein
MTVTEAYIKALEWNKQLARNDKPFNGGLEYHEHLAGCWENNVDYLFEFIPNGVREITGGGMTTVIKLRVTCAFLEYHFMLTAVIFSKTHTKYRLSKSRRSVRCEPLRLFAAITAARYTHDSTIRGKHRLECFPRIILRKGGLQCRIYRLTWFDSTFGTAPHLRLLPF